MPCEQYYTEDELIQPGNLCPIHQRPVEYFEEENYFFRLSRFEDRLLDWYAKHPTAMKPEHRGNEALGLIRGGLRDFSISRTSIQWGIPLPWDPAARHLRVVRRAHQLPRRGRLRRRHGLRGQRRLRRVVARRLPPDRQGHHPPPLRVLAGDADVGGHRPAEGLGDRRLAAQRRREDEQDVGQRGQPARPGRRRSASTASATTCSPTPPYGNDGDFTYEGLVDRYNSDLANNLGNLLARVATVVGKKCDGMGPAPDPSTARSRPPRRPPTTDTAAGWDIVHRVARSTPRGSSFERPTPTSRRTSRGRPSPAPRSTP